MWVFKLKMVCKLSFRVGLSSTTSLNFHTLLSVCILFQEKDKCGLCANAVSVCDVGQR